ncbi:hypothetical protein IMZ11_29210 [Microtetraspora sp. AC03309]|nr:hypothetical protein [Microtetraspora sp. AC03309]
MGDRVGGGAGTVNPPYGVLGLGPEGLPPTEWFSGNSQAGTGDSPWAGGGGPATSPGPTAGPTASLGSSSSPGPAAEPTASPGPSAAPRGSSGTTRSPEPSRTPKAARTSTPAKTKARARPTRSPTRPKPSPTGTTRTTPTTRRAPLLSASCPGGLGKAAGGVITLSAGNAAISWTATVPDGVTLRPAQGRLRAGASGRITLAVLDPGSAGSALITFRSAGGNPYCRVSWEGDAQDQARSTAEPT